MRSIKQIPMFELWFYIFSTSLSKFFSLQPMGSVQARKKFCNKSGPFRWNVFSQPVFSLTCLLRWLKSLSFHCRWWVTSPQWGSIQVIFFHPQWGALQAFFLGHQWGVTSSDFFPTTNGGSFQVTFFSLQWGVASKDCSLPSHRFWLFPFSSC